MGAVEKIHKAQAKEYEKVLKVPPLLPWIARRAVRLPTDTMADHLQAP